LGLGLPLRPSIQPPFRDTLYLSTALQFLADWRWEVWGVIVILVMIFRPQGILGRDTLNVRRWWRAREATAA